MQGTGYQPYLLLLAVVFLKKDGVCCCKAPHRTVILAYVHDLHAMHLSWHCKQLLHCCGQDNTCLRTGQLAGHIQQGRSLYVRSAQLHVVPAWLHSHASMLHTCVYVSSPVYVS